MDTRQQGIGNLDDISIELDEIVQLKQEIRDERVKLRDQLCETYSHVSKLKMDLYHKKSENEQLQLQIRLLHNEMCDLKREEEHMIDMARRGIIPESAMGSPEGCNWLKAHLVIRQLRTGLVDFLDECAEQFHQRILRSGKALRPCEGGICIGRKRLCDPCRLMKKELEQFMTGKSNWICLENADRTNWINNPWELCKCFMPFGYMGKESADDIDCVGLLAWIDNCKYVHDKFTRYVTGGRVKNKIEEVRTIRNDLTHSPNLQCGKPRLDDLVKYALDILDDNYKIKINQKSQQAKTEIHQIQNRAPITVEDFLSLMGDFTKKVQESENCIAQQASNIELMESQHEEYVKNLKDELLQKNIKIYDLKHELHRRDSEMHDELRKSKNKIHELEKELKSTDDKVCELNNGLQMKNKNISAHALYTGRSTSPTGLGHTQTYSGFQYWRAQRRDETNKMFDINGFPIVQKQNRPPFWTQLFEPTGILRPTEK